MATIKRWVLGRDCSVTVTGMTADTAGLLTAAVGGPTSFVGKTDRAEMRFNPRLDEISDMSSIYENDVPLKVRFEMTLHEIMKYAGSDLAALITTYQYFLVTLVTGAKQWVFYCTYGDGTFPYEVGKSVAQLSFRQIDIGATNPTYVAVP